MKQLTISNQQSAILEVLRYFFFFNYPPTLEEIHTFLKKKTSKRQITSILEKMEKESLVKHWRIGKRSGSWLGNKKLEVEIGTLSKNYFLYPFTKQASNPYSYIPSSYDNPSRYTLHQYTSLPLSSRAERPKGAKSRDQSTINNQQSAINNFIKKQQISIDKLNSRKFKLYIKLLSLFPQIKLVGLSGSVAMLNAGEDHDIDLFIITGKNRLWTGRFIALLLAQLLGIRRSRHSGKVRRSVGPRPESLLDSGVVPLSGTPQNDNNETMKQWSNTITNKVCLNLFFDESDLAVPKFKRSDYVAHEVLQMKPLIEKDSAYLRFIDANRWVFDIFPNARSGSTLISTQINADSVNPRSHPRLSASKVISNWIEIILKRMQLHFIKKHQTTEIVTDSQLWFHPDDFADKMNKLFS